MEVISRDVLETKLNLNLFKDIEKTLYRKSFCLFFLFYFETIKIKLGFFGAIVLLSID